MAKSKNDKENLVQTYKDLINTAQGMFFFNGSLNAANTQTLKSSLNEDAKLSLLKNTIFNIALKEADMDLSINGYNNVIFVKGRLIENASTLKKFVDENEYSVNQVTIGKSTYEGKKLKEISSLGSEQQVQGKLVGILSTPASLLVRDLISPVQKLAYVLAQIKPNN